jgi:hypothetical protein
VKRSLDAHEPDVRSRPDDPPVNAGAEEHEIDRILADSFPASDSPPWTLGVTQTPVKNSPTNPSQRDHEVST